MKKVHPIMLIVGFLILLICGLVWKVLSANECLKDNGVVVGAMTRMQSCESVD